MQITPLTHLKPQHVRLLALLTGLILLALTWTGYFFTIKALKNNFDRSMVASLAAEAALLDDHIDRSLNQVINTLVTAGSLGEIMPASPSALTPEELRQMVGNNRLIRSLSLVGPSREILTSSNPVNIGKTLPASALALATDNRNLADGGVALGPLLPYRDLFDWASAQPSSTQTLMPALLSFQKDGQTLTWIAVINIALFHNLWDRIEHNPAIEIAVFNYSGQKIISHHEQPINEEAIFSVLQTEMEKRQIGHFFLGKDLRYLVVYRADSALPKLLTTIADMKALGQDLSQESQFLLMLATLGSGLIVLILLAAYRLYLRHERAAAFTGSLLDGITAHLMMSRANTQGVIEDVNEPLLKLTGYQRDEVVGQNHRLFKGGRQTTDFYARLWDTISQGKIWRGTFQNKTKSGGLVWLNATIVPFRNEWGRITHYVAMYSDITQSVRVAEEYERELNTRKTLEAMNQKLLNDATRDPLTGTSNRRGLEQFLDQITQTETLVGISVSVLMLDVDHFKRLNDTWGHAAGDQVLKALSGVWLKTIRSSDLLVRLGGEEFAIILLRTPLAEAVIVAKKLLEQTRSLAIPIEGQQTPLKVTVSIGIAHAARTSDITMDALLKRADMALYAAKHQGRDGVQVYTEPAASIMME